MQTGRDGLIFVKIGKTDPWYVNVASITRVYSLSKEQCDMMSTTYPSVGLDILGKEDPISIRGLTAENMIERINKAIKDHYDDIVNQELLG